MNRLGGTNEAAMSFAPPKRCQLIAAIRTEIVRVVYSDESLASASGVPITVVTALMMNMDEHWPSVESALAKIKADTPRLLLDEKTGEIKGSHLYGAVRKVERLRVTGKNDPDLEKLEQAREILCRLLTVTIDNPTPIFYGAVDVAGYEIFQNLSMRRGPATPHDVAFDNCLARVNNVAHSELKKNEQILWIHDHRGKREQEETKTGLLWVRELTARGWNAETMSWEENRQRDVRVVVPVYFGHSHESSALQLADVCCSTIALQLLERFYSEVLATRGWQLLVEPFYAIIRNRVMNDGTDPLYRELGQNARAPLRTRHLP
jgi:hypothetical protein